MVLKDFLCLFLFKKGLVGFAKGFYFVFNFFFNSRAE